ncbi:Ribokinase [Mycobacterium tuberculosis]|nr:Ribokinase [Mycobacterium tuberculosis]
MAEIADVVSANEHEPNDWPAPPTHSGSTVGVRGARYVGAVGVFEVPAPTVTPVDTAGAGAAFAGFLAANWPRNPASPADRLR